MKPDRLILSPSSRFLIIVATAIIVLQFLANQLIPYPYVSDTGTLTTEDHLCLWIIVGLAELKTLAVLLLATWIGQLLQRRFPHPRNSVKSALRIIAAAGLALFGYGLLVQWLPPRFFGGCIIAALIQGYLVNAESVPQRRTRELALTCAALALAFLGFHCIVRHRWLSLFAMMPFLYYMLLLSYDNTVRRLMERPWARTAATVLSALSFLCAAYLLARSICHNWISIHYLAPLWTVLLQPLTVYPFILRWQKKHTCQVEQS